MPAAPPPRLALGLAVLALAGCDRRDPGPIDREAARALFDEIPLAVPPGMSDLTVDDRGVLWAIAERESVVVELELGKPPVTHHIAGLTPGLDTEALGWLGAGRFAIGIEGEFAPAAGIVFAELRGADLVVTGTRRLLDRDLGVALTINHGIEAVCGKDGELLAAAEAVGKDRGKRWAPLVRLRGDSLTVSRLWLTSAKGKVSALHCTIADDGTAEVLAIERHFGVARILTFTIGRDDTEVTPTIAYDLHPILHDAWNLEGITRLPDGRLVLINDNQTRTVSGPTQLLVFHPR